MKDENSVPAAQKMTDVSLSIFRSKFKKTRIQMIDYKVLNGTIIVEFASHSPTNATEKLYGLLSYSLI